MASQPNPFVNAINSFAADPEGEAKGRYVQANTAKTQNEADILADRLRWRGIFGAATDIAPTAKAGELSNPTVDAGSAFRATGLKGGQNLLFDIDKGGNLIPRADITPRDFGLASLLMGNAPNQTTSQMMSPTGGFEKPTPAPKVDYKLVEFTDPNTGVTYRQRANSDGSGVIKQDGSPDMVPLNPNTVKTIMPSAANGQVLQTTPGKDGAAPTTTALNLSGSNMIDGSKLAQAAKIAHANDTITRGMAPEGMSNIDYLVAKHIGHISPSGEVNKGVPMLNADELRSIQNLTAKIMGSDPAIPLSVAVAASIDHHKDISQGRVVPRDFDNRGLFDNFLGLGGSEDELDAAGVELPQLGKGAKFSTSKGYKRELGEVPKQREDRGRYSDLPDDVKVVPLAVRLAGNAVDETGLSQIMAGATGKPEFSTQLPPAGTPLEAGKFYHDGSKFYVAEFGSNGAVVARLITNIKK